MLADCDRVGTVAGWRARALNLMGWLLAEVEDHERAVEWNLQSLTAAVRVDPNDPHIQSFARLNRPTTTSLSGVLTRHRKRWRR